MNEPSPYRCRFDVVFRNKTKNTVSFLNTVLRAGLIPAFVDSESVIQTMPSMNLRNSSVSSKISVIGCKI